MHPLPPPPDLEPPILWRNVPRVAIAIGVAILGAALIRYFVGIM